MTLKKGNLSYIQRDLSPGPCRVQSWCDRSIIPRLICMRRTRKLFCNDEQQFFFFQSDQTSPLWASASQQRDQVTQFLTRQLRYSGTSWWISFSLMESNENMILNMLLKCSVFYHTLFLLDQTIRLQVLHFKMWNRYLDKMCQQKTNKNSFVTASFHLHNAMYSEFLHRLSSTHLWNLQPTCDTVISLCTLCQLKERRERISDFACVPLEIPARTVSGSNLSPILGATCQ
jgi:hypothetical protein